MGFGEVEFAFEAVHESVTDVSGVAQLDERLPLRLIELVEEPLVGQRFVLVPVVVYLPGPGRQSTLA